LMRRIVYRVFGVIERMNVQIDFDLVWVIAHLMFLIEQNT